MTDLIDFTFTQPKNTSDMDFAHIPDHVHSQYVQAAYVQSQAQSAAAEKVSIAQGVANAGKLLGVGADGDVTTVDDFITASSVTRWNVLRPNQTETPSLTLPVPESGKPQEIVYIFTAMTTGASFAAPSGYILFDGDTAFGGLTAGNTVQYSDLTVGSMYECDFLVIGDGKISLLIVEHAGV